MKSISLENALRNWQACYQPATEDHIPLERLYAFSQNNGMKTASKDELRHLSRCSQCLDQWELLCVVGDEQEAEPVETIVGYGFLKAAASKSFEPLSLVSECNQFTLGIYFDPDESGNGMVTLDVSLSSPLPENTIVVVEDKNEKCVLKAAVHDGRVARKVNRLKEFDFSKWTVTLSGNREK